MTPERWWQIKDMLQSALELSERQRATFLEDACQGDQPLRQEVEALLLQEKGLTEGFLRSPVTVTGQAVERDAASCAGRRIGPYEIIEIIGEGGMGSVYRAARADDQYQKQVAIKILKFGLQMPFALARFRAERQILANLEHPNIARMLDGGTTDEGLPYIVMELIEGQPIDQYCEARRLSIEKRLRLFRTVCLAVQYAHQHLVVHRDLKPANIMVTADGIPKLLDFGIAKILATGSIPGGAETTIDFMRMLTPEYASPEQVRGGTVTTASDVYSLGVVLYELLSGSSPYQVMGLSPHDVIRAVCECEPERPSLAPRRTTAKSEQGSTRTPENTKDDAHDGSRDKLRKRLSGDLDNIVLVALRKEPQGRYSSVEQLAEDIRRHLENLPVVARSDTIRYRTLKFVTRHKTGVLAAGLVTLTLLASIAVTIREARLAEERFNDSRSLANSLIFDIHDSIQDLPGATPARKLIVEKALQYLDRLATASGGDPSLQRELAAAYKRIGDVQGYPYSANLGDTAGARKSYEKALAIRQSLYSSNALNVDDAVGLAESSRLLGEILAINGDTKAALEGAKHSIQVIEQTDRIHPDDVMVLQELSKDYESEADLLAGNFNTSSLGDNFAALALRHKERAVEERLMALRPDDLSMNRDLAARAAKMGDQLLLDGQWREALPYYVQAQNAMENLANRSQNTKTLEYLDSMYSRVQEVKIWNGDFRQALAINLRAVEISKKLRSTDPQSTKARLALSIDWANVADSASRLGEKRQAVSALGQGLALVGELVKFDPKNTEFQGIQAAEYGTAGDVYRRLDDVSQSLHYYREALSLTLRIQSQDSNNADARLRYAAISNRVGEMLARSGDMKGASEMLNKALGLAKPEASANHPNEQAVYSTADSYANLAEIEAALAVDTSLAPEKRVGHWIQASSLGERCLKTWAQIREPGLISPDGFDCVPASVVTQRLAKYKAALASEQTGSQH